MSCERCRFWFREEQGFIGICKRRAPQVIISNQVFQLEKGGGSITTNSKTQFPSTSKHEWCGDGEDFNGVMLPKP